MFALFVLQASQIIPSQLSLLMQNVLAMINLPAVVKYTHTCNSPLARRCASLDLMSETDVKTSLTQGLAVEPAFAWTQEAGKNLGIFPISPQKAWTASALWQKKTPIAIAADSCNLCTKVKENSSAIVWKGARPPNNPSFLQSVALCVKREHLHEDCTQEGDLTGKTRPIRQRYCSNKIHVARRTFF